METINFITRRIIAYPSLAIGVGLTIVGRWLVIFAAWLTDNEDLIKENSHV